MFQPGPSHDETAEAGAPTRAARKPAPPAVDAGLRAGAKLAQAREMLGLSLDEVAERTRVRRDFLEALETMNVKLLPGSAYALAYLRSYASVLGLDVEALVTQFKQESALTREDARAQLRNPESKPRRERPWLAAAAIALAAAAFIGWRAYEARESDPRLQTAEAAASGAPVIVEPAPLGPAAAPASVIEIKALSEAWLEVRSPDGAIFLSRTLQPGSRYRPDVGAGWTIHARDGGAFEVSIDGVKLGLLGDPGAPVLGRRVDALGEAGALTPLPSPAPQPAG